MSAIPAPQVLRVTVPGVPPSVNHQYVPDRRRRDTHNAHKVLLDAMQGIVYVDDADVLPRVMGAEVDREHPRVEIEVERVREEAV